MGTPIKLAAEMNRPIRFELRLNEEESVLLRDKATALGVSAADYIRILIRSADITLSRRENETKRNGGCVCQMCRSSK